MHEKSTQKLHLTTNETNIFKTTFIYFAPVGRFGVGHMRNLILFRHSNCLDTKYMHSIRFNKHIFDEVSHIFFFHWFSLIEIKALGLSRMLTRRRFRFRRENSANLIFQKFGLPNVVQIFGIIRRVFLWLQMHEKVVSFYWRLT